jgi:hypothetical protein
MLIWQAQQVIVDTLLELFRLTKDRLAAAEVKGAINGI